MDDHRSKNGRTTYLAAITSIINELRRQKVTSLQLGGLVSKGTDDSGGVNALNDEELDALYSLQIDDDNLRKSRDLFIVMCLTGLSFADTRLVRVEDIGAIITRKKTGSPCLIADSQRLRDVLQRNGGTITNSHVHDSSTLSKHIKQLCRMAAGCCPSFERIVRNTQQELVPFYKTLGTHSGRKTFISRNYLADRSPALIMKFTGHKSVTKLDHYIRNNIATEQASKMMVG
jgi:integrase